MPGAEQRGLGAVAEELRGRAYELHWRVRDRLEPRGLASTLAFLRATERWPRAQLEAMRDEKLRRLVAHAYGSIPGYRRLMDQHGVRPADVRGVGDLTRLPVMTKDLLRAGTVDGGAPDEGDLVARDMRARDLEVGTTGGTTGAPMRLVRDRAGTVWMRAAYWRGFSWAGLDLRRPWVQLFGGSLGQGARPFNDLKNWFAGKVFLPAFELDERNVSEYAAAVQRSGARHLVGYASACAQLATLVERAGLTLRFDAVFPTAELLLPPWRDVISRVFGGKVLPYYGCGEVQSIAYSCPDAVGDDGVAPYHLCDEHVVVEVESGDGHAALEGEGAFLITDLDNFAMPLIRYRNGDAGSLAGPGCPCGRTLGRMLRVDGRVNDVLLTTGGERISGVIGTHAFKYVRGATAFQVVQRRPGHALVRIVRTEAYDTAVEEPKLRQIFTRHLGEGADVAIEYVAEIPRTAAGKARFVINEYLAGPVPRADSAA